MNQKYLAGRKGVSGSPVSSDLLERESSLELLGDVQAKASSRNAKSKGVSKQSVIISPESTYLKDAQHKARS
jgi:hypothetical protein